MKIHLIAIGGAAMHNIALDLALHHEVTGSDDEIYNPSRSRLEKEGLLPDEMGWFPDRITPDLDLVILGMHAKADNPELAKAQELGLKVMSYPEFIYHHSKDKKRVVIAGSHGKTTTTSMVLHVLQRLDYKFDYLVGAQIEGFERMVKLSQAPVIILEGDEYLSSCLDRRPKMLHYQPDVAVITGIAWDHINVFPDFEDYKNQFGLFIDSMQSAGSLFYFGDDTHLPDLISQSHNSCKKQAYAKINIPSRELSVFGDHNLQNMEAARLICNELGVSKEQFAHAISDFNGAGKRLEKLYASENFNAYLDFAHAPSKVKATTEAVRQQYPDAQLIAFFELHTFSSLNKDFIPHYKETLAAADKAYVYYDPHTLKMKGMPQLNPTSVKVAFNHNNLEVIIDKELLLNKLRSVDDVNTVLLMMSSGKFGKIDIKKEIMNIAR